MKSFVTSAITMAIALNLSSACADEIRLSLESSDRAPRVGDQITLELKLLGSAVRDIAKGTEGVVPDIMAVPAFVYRFKVSPKHAGNVSYGPYSLAVSGQKLTSNLLSIDVLPQWGGEYGTLFRVERTSVSLGEDVVLIAETWAKTSIEKTFELAWNDNSFDRVTSSSSCSSHSGPGGEVNYEKQSWVLRPKQVGEFKITRDLFTEFPDAAKPPSISVMVNAAAQPKAGASGVTAAQP